VGARPPIPKGSVLRVRDPYPTKHAAEGLQLTKPGASWNSPREAHRSATARARGCEFGAFLIHNDKVTTLRRTCRDSDHNRQQFGLGGDDPKRLTSVRRLRKKGVGIGKIARTLGIGASYVQRVVAETEAKRSGIEHRLRAKIRMRRPLGGLVIDTKMQFISKQQ
jgi:hypothetical protein